MNQQLSPLAQRLLIQVACSAVLACIVVPGPVLWLTAVLVCIGGIIMAFIATVLFAIDTVCNIIGAAFPRTRRHSPRVKLLLRVCAALPLIAAFIEPAFVLISAAICIIAWGGRISDYCNRRCGIRNPIALCALRSLLALAPLGIMNYVLHLIDFFL